MRFGDAQDLCGNGAQPPPMNVSNVEMSGGRINLGKVNRVAVSERVVDALTKVLESMHRVKRRSVRNLDSQVRHSGDTLSDTLRKDLKRKQVDGSAA